MTHNSDCTIIHICNNANNLRTTLIFHVHCKVIYLCMLTLLLFCIFVSIRCICRTTISLLHATTWSTKAGQNCMRASRFAHQERQGGVRRSARGGRALPYSTFACVRPYPFVHLRIGRRFMGISSALWTTGGRAVCAPVHETRPQARPPPRSDGGRDCGGIAEGDSER